MTKSYQIPLFLDKLDSKPDRLDLFHFLFGLCG